MTIEIKVPVLPESVSDATLLDWRYKVGDSVARDEIVVEVETDKVVLEVPAPMDGVLSDIFFESGSTVLGGQVLASLKPGDAPIKAEEKTKDEAKASSLEKPTEKKEDVKVSPAASRVLAENNLDVSNVVGSAPGGRITKEDVLHSIASKDKKEKVVQSEIETKKSVSSRGVTKTPMSRLRKTIASRLLSAQQNTAMLTTFNEVNMQAVMEARSKYKEDFEKTHGARLGFMSFFVKASLMALQRYPMVNSYIEGNEIVQPHYYDIGIAVSSPRGLLVPIVRDCDDLSINQIESQISHFGALAKDGKIELKDLSGGTFTITNGGVFGSLLSTPILNHPQSAILGMHKIQERPMVINGEIVVAPMMYLALSYDHRIIDGREAVQFLVSIKNSLEDPVRLLLNC